MRFISFSTLWRVTSVAAAFVGTALSGTIDISTSNASNWLVSIPSVGVISQPAIAVNSNHSITITDTTNRLGNCIQGCNLSNFNGYWTADFMFTLPANAFDATLTFSGLKADDRAVLLLNGVAIGDYSLNGMTDSALSGVGNMTLPGGNVTYTFNAQDTAGTVTSHFILGGLNDLELVINNTGLGQLMAPTQNFIANGDETGAILNGTITYTPEPAPGMLLLVSLAPLAYWLRRRRSHSGAGF